MVPKTEPCNSYQSQQPVEYKSEKEIMVNDRDLDKLFESDSADTSDDEHLVRKRERERDEKERREFPPAGEKDQRKESMERGVPSKRKTKPVNYTLKSPLLGVRNKGIELSGRC